MARIYLIIAIDLLCWAVVLGVGYLVWKAIAAFM
jgi:hypothetical protein